MVLSAKTVAHYFLSRSIPNTNRSITHLKLQKLVYYAQAWHLALRETPLINDDFEAWIHGPVCPNLYYEYRGYGYHDIPAVDDEKVNINDTGVEQVLEAVWTAYGSFDGKYLEELTHQETPWNIARQNLTKWSHSNKIISHQSMKDFYMLAN